MFSSGMHLFVGVAAFEAVRLSESESPLCDSNPHTHTQRVFLCFFVRVLFRLDWV